MVFASAHVCWSIRLAAAGPDFELVVFQTALYRTSAWRRYNLRTTLMSIVGPQVFIRWIRFARGNLTLGPFVRMIFKVQDAVHARYGSVLVLAT